MSSQNAVLTGARSHTLKINSMQVKRVLLLAGLAAITLLAWALLWDKTDWLSSPAETWDFFVQTIRSPETYVSLAATLSRLVIGLCMGYVAGLIAAFLMHKSRWWERFTRPYVFIALSTPALAMCLISLMVFRLSDFGVYMATAGAIFPFVSISLLAGLNSIDAHLTEMTEVFRFSWFDRIWHQALPEIAPHLFAAFRNVHALAWKIVVLAELFSTQSGIGYQYKRAFAFFSTKRLIVWAIFFIIMVMIVEYGILRPFERLVFRWRS